MCKTNTPTTLSILKSRFTLFVILGLACLTMGCSQINAMKDQQITLQENVEINTEKAASLHAKMVQHQQDMDTALGAILKEQRILKSRQEGLQQSVASVSTHAEGMAGRMQTLSQQLSTLSNQFDQGQQLMAANYESLSEKQNSHQDGIDSLERSRETLASKRMSLQSEQVSLSGLADNNRNEIGALALTSQATEQAVEELTKLSDSRHEDLQTLSTAVDQRAATLTRIQEDVQLLALNIQSMQTSHAQNTQLFLERSDELTKLADSHHEELQTLSTGVDQRTATLTRIQEDVQLLALNIQSMQTSHAQNKRLFLERSEELLDMIKEFQADHSQWQERLSSLQQEIGLVRDSTSTLDDKVDQLGKVDQLEEVAAPE